MYNAIFMMVWVAVTYAAYYSLLYATERIMNKFYELMSTNIQYWSLND